MINIYDRFASKNDVLFTNGLAVLDDVCIKAEIIEKLNGEYGLSAIFSLDKENKKHEFIGEESIIKCDDVYGAEVFRISKVTKRSNREIEVYARHISYDTANLFLEDVRPTSQNGQGFLDWIFTHTTTSHEFTYFSNITKTATSYFINRNVHETLFTTDNCFLNVLGGEVARRQYQIAINNTIGSNNGVTIQSRKNLKGFEVYTDIDTVITRIYPKGKDNLVIDEKYIDSQYVNNYPNIKSKEINFSDIGVDSEKGITEAQAKQQLKDAVNKMFTDQQVDLLKAEYKINFVALEKTEEYKNFAILERIWLGDTVSVYEENFDIDINVRVIERKWNVLKQVHNNIVLSNIAEKAMSKINRIVKLLNSMNDNQTGILQQAKDSATELIKNGITDSYVLVRKNEILIMDTDDVNTAVKVWRWNKNGLGYSSTGYNGTFGLAMTIDGSIVADFITTGILDASLIKTGYLKSFNNLTWINMEDGTFNFADKFTYDGQTFYFDGDLITSLDGSVITGRLKSVDGSVDIDLSNGAFQIGGRTSDTTQHTNSYSKYNHTDGSYTKVSADGLERYVDGTGKNYHYLMYTSEAVIDADMYNTEVTITLPSEFQGKDFKVITGVQNTGNITSTGISNLWCAVRSINTVNGTFNILAYARIGVDTYVNIQFSYTVIA